MKTLISKYWLAVVALVTVCAFTACSSDDDETIVPVFPQMQTIAGAVGDVKELTFEANDAWSLSSSKMWCKIMQGEEAGYVLNGTAGKQTVKIEITADEASNDLSVAQINMKMGGKEVAIAEVHRSANGYELKVFDAEGNDITETGLVAGYDEYTQFTVKSNYRFAVTNTPEWAVLEGGFLVGRPNVSVNGGIMFQEGVANAKYAIAKEAGYTVTFASEDGKAEVTVPVIYNGMPTNTIDVTYPTSSPWADWTVSLDGKTFSQTGGTGVAGEASSDTFTFSNFLPFSLKTAGDDFTLVVFKKESWGLEADYTRFVKATGEKGDIRLTIDELASGEREAYVYALPTKEYEALGNPEQMIDQEDGTVSWMYNKYFLMHFTQKENKKEEAGADEGKAPTVIISGYLPVECKKETSGDYDIYAEFIGYDGKEIYYSEVNAGSWVTVSPNIDGWEPTDMSDIVAITGGGEELSVEPGMDTNDNWAFSFDVTSGNAPCVLGFKDGGKIVKMIIVNINWDAQSKKNRK